MCLNALPVREILFRRLGRVEPQCPLCLEDVESIDHLFGNCLTTLAVWNLAIQHRWIPQELLGDQSHTWFQSFDTWKKLDSKIMQ